MCLVIQALQSQLQNQNAGSAEVAQPTVQNQQEGQNQVGFQYTTILPFYK